MGDYQARFCERLRVKLPLPTRLPTVGSNILLTSSKSMKHRLFFLFSIIPVFSFGQTIEVLEKKSSDRETLVTKEFHYVLKDTNLSTLEKTGTLKGKVTNAKHESIVEVFNALWDTANELGSNSFQIEQVEFNSINSIIITISIYSLTEIQIDSIYSFYPLNMIYIIGDLNPKALEFKPKTIKVNGIKVQLPPSKYLSYQNKIGEEITVGIGGLMGAKMWIKGKNKRLPTYLSMNSFGVGPGNPGEIGMSFNTGRIYYVDMNFGQFLVEILENGR